MSERLVRIGRYMVRPSSVSIAYEDWEDFGTGKGVRFLIHGAPHGYFVHGMGVSEFWERLFA